MALRFGGELESTKSKKMTSTIEARRLFFSLILEMKREVVTDLVRLFKIESLPEAFQSLARHPLSHHTKYSVPVKFFLLHTKKPDLFSVDLSEAGFKHDIRDTPILAYFDFIFKNQSKFDKLLKKSEAEHRKFASKPSRDLITTSALEKLIPSWDFLQSKGDSKWLCSELTKWAEKWNLTDEWCLDFALGTLSAFKVSFIDKMQFPDDFLENADLHSVWELNRYCEQGTAWSQALFELNQFQDHLIPATIPDYPSFEYRFKQTVGERTYFSIKSHYNPWTSGSGSFKASVEEQFWRKFFDCFANSSQTFDGNTKELADGLNSFVKYVDEHISRCEKLGEPFSRPTPTKESDRHFRWLVEFQLLCRSKEELRKTHGCSRKAIRDGIEDVARLLKLTLRPDSKGGRPSG